MSGTRRAGRPIVAVLLTSALMLAGARFIGRVAAPAAPGGEASREAATPQQAAAVPDLTFYSTLGDAPAPRGKGAAKGTGEAALRAAPGDIVPVQGIYVVQVTGGDEARAKRVRDRLASKGFPAAAIQDDDGGAWRVRVGRWKDRGPAEAMAERIRKETGLQPWVLREGER